MILEQSRIVYNIPKCFLDCSKMFWNVQKCLNCVSTFFYMHNCDKVCVPKGVPKHVPKNVPNWAEMIIVSMALFKG